MSGLQALFGAEAARLLRTGWGDRIWEFSGMDDRTGKPKFRPRDTGVQPLADEVYAILMSRKPLETFEPLTIINHGAGPALNIVNTNPEAPAISVFNQISNVTNGDTVNSVNEGDVTNLYDNSVSIGPSSVTINEGDSNVTLSPTIINNFVTQNITQIFVDVNGNPVNNDDPCNRVVRPFRLKAYVQEGQTVLGDLLTWSGGSWTATGSQFTLATDFFTGAYLTNDLGLAQWDCRSSRFYLIGAGHIYFRGTLEGDLNSGGVAQVAITGDTQEFLLKEVYGLHGPLGHGTKIGATWNKKLKQWEGTVATC